METNWTLGTLIFFYGIIPLALLSIAGIIGGIIRQHHSNAYEDGGAVTAFVSGFVLFCILAIVPWAMYPYETQYHSYTPVAGTVESIGSRLLSDGNSSVNLVYVVTFAGGNGQQYKVNDTRMSLVNVGDPLSIQCVREWQFEGVDGWNCAYAGEDA